jgi:glyoxylase-like metal-dependent hydrolase (beta-lactamase superfamily II)
VLVIDTGGSAAQGQALLQAIREVTDLPVRWIVLTHAHADHVLGASVLRGPKTEIYSTIIAQQQIEQEGPAWATGANKATGAGQPVTSVVMPARIVESWTELSLGEMKVVLWPIRPAHSPSDLVVWLPKQRILFAGDAVTSGSMPVLKDAHVQSWLTALRDLESLGVARVVPGHGAVTSGVAVQRQHDLLDDLWKLVQDGQKGEQNYVDITARARNMIANRHARYFPDFELGLTDNVQAILKQLPPLAAPK